MIVSKVSVSIAVSSLLLASSAIAQSSSDDIAELRRQLDQQQEQIQSLNSEVGQLRATQGEKWLTEHRATEIRHLVSDILADSDQRASLMQGGLTAGWDNGFFLGSQDGRFALNIGGQMQIRWVYNYQRLPDRQRQGFENTRTKMYLDGHVFNPDLTYFIEFAITRNEPGLVDGIMWLEDAWVRYKLNNDWSVRFGQYKVPFNREELIPSSRQLAVERSLNNEVFNLGRTQGIEVMYAGEHFRGMFSFDEGGTDSIGTVAPGGTPINTGALVEDVEWAVHGRTEWKLAGTWEQFTDLTSTMDDPFGMLIGVAGHFQRGEHGAPDATEDEDEWWAYTVDISVEFGGANLMASWIQHRIDTPSFSVEGFAAQIQGGWYFTPKFEVFGRYEWGQVQASTSAAFETLNVLTLGFNYYFDGHDVKLTTDFGFAFTEVNGTVFASDLASFRGDAPGNQNQIVFRTQFQLLF